MWNVGWGFEQENFILGMTCDPLTGIFKENDGITPITFQKFPRGHPVIYEHDTDVA